MDYYDGLFAALDAASGGDFVLSVFDGSPPTKTARPRGLTEHTGSGIGVQRSSGSSSTGPRAAGVDHVPWMSLSASGVGNEGDGDYNVVDDDGNRGSIPGAGAGGGGMSHYDATKGEPCLSRCM
jgi:hypothetical protein